VPVVPLLWALALSLFGGCSSADDLRLGAEAPYAVKVRTFRVPVHADQLRVRLEAMGIESYLVTTYDPSKGPRTLVLTGTSEELAAARSIRQGLSDEHKIYETELISFRDIPSDMDLSPDMGAPSPLSFEPQEVAAPAALWDTLKKLPKHNDFVLRKVTAFLPPTDPTVKEKHRYESWSAGLDLPRGIDEKYLDEVSVCFVEAIYRDTLDNTDQVTVDIVRLALNHGAGANPASTFADRILETGVYSTEKKFPWSAEDDSGLTGYEVLIEPSTGSFRRYLIANDAAHEFVFVFQTKTRSVSQLEPLAATLGDGAPLVTTGYFKGLIRTLPEKPPEGDHFVGLQLAWGDKETLRERGYTGQSAEKIPPHWGVRGFYYNESKGPWSLAALDLFSPTAVAELERSRGKKVGVPTFIYGTAGVRRTTRYWDTRRHVYRQKTSRFEWSRGRYLATARLQGGWLGGEELQMRAELMQLDSPGGWAGRK
jgi:hypothetical protein